MEEKCRQLKKKRRVAVAWAQDTNTLGAVHMAVKKGFIEANLIGKPDEIVEICKIEGIDPEKLFNNKCRQ